MGKKPSVRQLRRDFVAVLEGRLREERPLVQVILGPRQVGKTTGVQMLSGFGDRVHYATADEVLSESPDWISEQWQAAKLKGDSSILVIDEVQKVLQWSERIKSLWDAERRKRGSLKVVLLGSSSLSIHQGLDESLTGRFEVIPVRHWSFEESRRQFGYNLDDFLVYGGYPEAARFRGDFRRWQAYLKSSIIETVVGKDILRQGTVRKPALFRQTFELLARYPAQEVSYTSLLGQLQEKGNVELVKHYIELFEGAFLFRSIHKYSGSTIRHRASSPKLFPLCPALCSHPAGEAGVLDPETRGRVFEAAVGAELARLPGELSYWREHNAEVDFVYEEGKSLFAVEAKSGRRKRTRGIQEFQKRYPGSRVAFVTPENFQAFCGDPTGFLRDLAT